MDDTPSPQLGISSSRLQSALTMIDVQQLAFALVTGNNISQAETRALLERAGVPSHEIEANIEPVRKAVEDHARKVVPQHELDRLRGSAEALESKVEQLAAMIQKGTMEDGMKQISNDTILNSPISPGQEEATIHGPKLPD
jgi:hypothetical protein